MPSNEGAPRNTPARSNGRKRKRTNNDNDEGKSRTYAPPEKYAHLDGVPDAIDHGLVLLLVGLNPGVTTATVGHAYDFHYLYIVYIFVLTWDLGTPIKPTASGDT